MIGPAVEALSREIGERSARLGRRVEVADLGVLDRAGHLPLSPPGRTSPNGACRLVRAADGWLAVNLARDEDQALIPAWLQADEAASWEAIAALALSQSRAALLAQAELLGLPVAAVSETPPGPLLAPSIAQGRPHPRARRKVVDLSALWAGPLCGAVLAALGAPVVKVESIDRPDPTGAHTPGFDAALNGAKQRLALDFRAPDDAERLADLVREADVLITSARPRGLASIGLSPGRIADLNPSLVWVAITGHGWRQGGRVAFGDDAAAAGGLVAWSGDEPRFVGDALADPVTGLCAAAAVLAAMEDGRSAFIDAGLAPCAAAARGLAA